MEYRWNYSASKRLEKGGKKNIFEELMVKIFQEYTNFTDHNAEKSKNKKMKKETPKHNTIVHN